MRMLEILLEETVSGEIANSLMDWLTAYQTQGQVAAPMTGPSGAVSYLRKQGFRSTDPQLIMDMLSGPKFSSIVRRSTPRMIYLLGNDKSSSVSSSELDKSADKVMKGAAKGAEKIVKNMSKTGI